MSLTCFKSYDVRARVGADLNEDIAYRIGRSFARTLGAEKVVLGRDNRPSSLSLSGAVARGLIDDGCEVLDLGLSGTEEMYCATSHFSADGGITITASHNPIDYNGMKMVGAGSVPLDTGTELSEIKRLAEANSFGPSRSGGQIQDVMAKARAAYVERVVSFADVSSLRPLKIVVNAGNGAAGPTFDAIAAALKAKGAPLEFVRMHHTPDSTFPNGIPNPLLEQNRPITSNKVRAEGADLGIAWDGDFDRCFFFDHKGAFVEGEYIVGLFAELFLRRERGAKIIHDPRVVWNTQDVVSRGGGDAVQSQTGHVYIKQAMRSHNAVYGGEMSAHHYFRDFFYCDSGMVPMILMAGLVSLQGPLADLVEDRRKAFPSSGEVNFHLAKPLEMIASIRAAFEPKALAIDETDGVSLDMGDWRFNLRSSNTEPLVRLNIETRGRPIDGLLAEFKGLLEEKSGSTS